MHPPPPLANHMLLDDPTPMQILRAWSPYGVLVLCVLLWGWKPLQTRLNVPTISFAWPWLHDAVLRMPPIVNAPAPYHAMFAFNWLGASGNGLHGGDTGFCVDAAPEPRKVSRRAADCCAPITVAGRGDDLGNGHRVRDELQRGYRDPGALHSPPPERPSRSSARCWDGSGSFLLVQTPPPTHSSATCRPLLRVGWDFLPY